MVLLCSRWKLKEASERRVGPPPTRSCVLIGESKPRAHTCPPTFIVPDLVTYLLFFWPSAIQRLSSWSSEGKGMKRKWWKPSLVYDRDQGLICKAAEAAVSFAPMFPT